LKLTNISKYGYFSPLSNEFIKEKSKKSMIRKYGVDNISKLDIIKEQRSDTMKENTIKYNKIIFEKYGVDNISKLEYIKQKKRDTTFKNYGVENPSQSSEIFERSQISGKKIKKHKCGLMYRGTYELDFLNFCELNNIIVQKGLKIEYIYNNNKKYYHSDFFIPDKNLVIEIKSSYYYYKFEDINKVKQLETIKNGYNFIFVFDKDYTHFLNIL
jgi:hypothetical protein